ncbi:ATP-binding protein [Thiothrix nivea]|uniref:AAA-ATPase-like protein n=1 Tax=Thiothrix nivea (strain ATCC 35100 / DSM 5205 / JP2) TaxID=870187 RepID=A0A656HGL8_THINJ|nr:ATP-binding protein [Thiothrix nivea]EIJ35164.1 AAA-ATPase-like protein [Thiothrix nivea DSM 5205]
MSSNPASTMQRKSLPIGIQTFSEIRCNNHYYVDKSHLAAKLAKEAKHYFLSRPRRFGKSLFLDTLKELFEGNEPLFAGLAAHDQWDWSVKYPVLRFSFGGENFRETQRLADTLDAQLRLFEEQYQLPPQVDSISGRFAHLIVKLHQQAGQPVVVLIDEYDKPILDALLYPEVARANRDFLRGFYGNIKDYDAHIKFSFLTGVSNFSKVSLFSGLNNLNDITLDKRYSTVCGYTDNDLDSVFSPELQGLDRDQIRSWYNGYHWLGEGVYNPFDILQLFDKREFKSYWFETGTPTFLLDLLFQRQVPSLQLGEMISSSSMLSSFDVDDITIEALLFQTGYLTIHKEENLGGQYFYTLGYPNREVYQSLNESLLSVLVKDKSKQAVQSLQLYRLLEANDFEGLKRLFHAFFASIPYHWYSNNDIQNYEGYYASVFYSYFASLGLKVTLEDITNLGRIDMTLQFNGQVYIFEFKVVEMAPEGNALQQIKDRAYADKYQGLQQPIHLLGVEFSKASRNIVSFEVEHL